MADKMWPPGVPHNALVGTLMVVRQDARIRFKPDRGEEIIRAGMTSGQKTCTFSVLMTADQYTLFRRWYANELGQGSLSFTRPDPEELCGTVIRSFTFVEPFSPEFVTPSAVKVSMALSTTEDAA